jgi:hypothetical protein
VESQLFRGKKLLKQLIFILLPVKKISLKIKPWLLQKIIATKFSGLFSATFCPTL